MVNLLTQDMVRQKAQFININLNVSSYIYCFTLRFSIYDTFVSNIALIKFMTLEHLKYHIGRLHSKHLDRVAAPDCVDRLWHLLGTSLNV